MNANPSQGRRKKRRSGRVMRWVVVFVVVLLIATGGAAGYGYWWVNRYVQSDAFRLMLQNKLGEKAKANVELTDLNITGPFVHVSTGKLTPKIATGWKELELNRLEATVDLGGWRQQVIELSRVHLDKLALRMRDNAEKVGEFPVVADTEVEEVKVSKVPEWVRRWIPNKARIDSVEVESFELEPADPNGVRIVDLHVTGSPVDSNLGLWQLRGKKGLLKIPASEEPFRFDSAVGRLSKDGLVLHDSVARWIDKSEVTARGELPFGKSAAWKFEGNYRDLSLSPFLSEATRKHINGDLSGTYDVNAERFHTKVQVTDGVIQNLPLLERVADFTRTAQFRRLVLDEASADVTKQGDAIQVRQLVLHSKGLVKVEGSVDVRGRALVGDLYVGVTTSTLRWIPGSQSRVFTEERADAEPGFVWTRVRLTGTLDSPKEDLSNRLLAAMGKALILDAPLGAAEMGVDILKGAGGVAGEAAKTGVEAGESVIKGAGKAMEKGADLLKKVIPGL